MTAYRKAAVAAAAGTASLLVTVLAAGPASAHGAPTDPVSRAAACDPQGGTAARSAACQAAAGVRGSQPLTEWDNLRVPGVAGRDRETIPDGKLCSGGLDAYAGLDLPRADWPTTKLTGGRAFTLTYRSTIPHRGTFKLFVTRDGYDPTRPLRWADLEARPFATAVNPALSNGAYRIRASLPGARSGRHVLYTIWQNSDTPDTYYSCSDILVVGGDKPAPAEGTSGNASSGGSREKTGAAAGRTKDPSTADARRDKGQAIPPASGSDGKRTTGGSSGTGYGRADGGVPLSEPVPAGSNRGSGGSGTTLAVVAGAVVLLAAAGVAAATLRRRRS